MAWMSLGLNCAHFDVMGMCQDLERSIALHEYQNLSLKNCFRLGELSQQICGTMRTASWYGVLFGLLAGCVGTKQAVLVYVEWTWPKEGSQGID